MSDIKYMSVRVPLDLHSRLTEQAHDDRRSLHAEVLEILDAYFDPHRLRVRLSELERTPESVR